MGRRITYFFSTVILSLAMDEVNTSDSLQNDFDELKCKYQLLRREFDDLQQQYNENVIIESMNEMKTRYDSMIRNTVSSTKYNSLLELHKDLLMKTTTVHVISNHIMELFTLIKPITTENKNVIARIQYELDLIAEFCKGAQ